jgi:hypothetical protein
VLVRPDLVLEGKHESGTAHQDVDAAEIIGVGKLSPKMDFTSNRDQIVAGGIETCVPLVRVFERGDEPTQREWRDDRRTLRCQQPRDQIRVRVLVILTPQDAQ